MVIYYMAAFFRNNLLRYFRKKNNHPGSVTRVGMAFSKKQRINRNRYKARFSCGSPRPGMRVG